MQDEDVLQQTILEIAARHTDTELSRALFAQRSFEHSPYVWQQYSRVLTFAGEEDAGRAAYAYAQNMGWGQKVLGRIRLSYESQFCYPQYGTLVFLSACGKCIQRE